MNHHNRAQATSGLQIIHDLERLSHGTTLEGIHRGTSGRQFAGCTQHDRVADREHINELAVERCRCSDATTSDDYWIILRQGCRCCLIAQHIDNCRFAVGQALADVV